MKDMKNHRAKDSRVSEAESAEPGHPLEDVPEAKAAKWTFKPLKKRGAYKLDGFEAIYGFGPR